MHNNVDGKLHDRSSAGSVFSDLERAKPDGIFNLKTLFLADRFEKKVNLSIGGTYKEREIVFSLYVYTCT